ncbi:O-antigen polymerase [Thiomicrorhabdus sp. Kp2]|uniref:O-antigen polymerase n=1 Tax=Thiomicrorhabdus sp. Kp2 TaxID=1123518 RepID=UPI00040DC0CF|nr:O-antigen polymerase [Thiomicrorhabdus sp. Kp2]
MLTIPGTFFLFVWLYSFFKRDVLFFALLLAAIMQGSSAFVLGSINLPVFAFIQVLIIIRYFVLWLIAKKTKFELPFLIGKIFPLMVFFFLSTVIFTLLSTVFFSGIPVLSPKLGIDNQYQYPQGILALSVSNFAQLMYLFLNISTVLFVANYVLTKTNKFNIRRIFWMFFGVTVVLYAYQYVFLFHGENSTLIDAFFFNNTSYAISNTQSFSLMPRFSGSFLEPSMAGLFLSSLSASLAVVWFFLAKRERNNELLMFFILSFALLLATTSSVGFISFFIVSLLALLVFIWKRWFRSKYQYFMIFVAVFFTLVIIVTFFKEFEVLFNFALFDKFESDSYIHRSYSNVYSINLFFETYGMGVGLGNNRPSSAIFYLLSNIGLVSILLLYIIWRVLKHSISYMNSVPVLFFLVFTVTVLINMFFAVPDLNLSFLWLSLGFLIGFIDLRILEKRNDFY